VYGIPQGEQPCKRSNIIAAVTNRLHKRTHKFGIEVTMSWDECVRLDTENGNTIWQDTVRGEMKNIRVEFNIMDGDEAFPPAYQDIHCHMIFDVKVEYFRYKARFVYGGHTTDIPHAMTHASVLSQDSVRITLALAALNDVDVNIALYRVGN
jgi:hypothetical protein